MDRTATADRRLDTEKDTGPSERQASHRTCTIPALEILAEIERWPESFARLEDVFRVFDQARESFSTFKSCTECSKGTLCIADFCILIQYLVETLENCCRHIQTNDASVDFGSVSWGDHELEEAEQRLLVTTLLQQRSLEIRCAVALIQKRLVESLATEEDDLWSSMRPTFNVVLDSHHTRVQHLSSIFSALAGEGEHGAADV
ncbi:hypothetical protein BDZ85DRAFT_46592 [Elsinoe ampelina]|uniref:Uncharacterized protein n=1 Tax=Elsinoe ampelina TaxID=302913 RepID=A0A6A6G0I7_9PEZI|nr:hypothetical protein BDZ85DRAFT_46592 [Elsinoe ampelina]